MQQKNTIIWCMLTQIWNACTDTFFCHFRPFFAFFAPLLTPKINIWKKCKKTPGHIILLHMCTINQDHMMNGSWDMKFNRQNFFVILDSILPFYPPSTLKNENIKNDKSPGDMIILHKCTKNHDHMLYCSWYMLYERCNCYFSFWAIFYLFTPLTAQKMKISKQWKNTWIYHFT